MKLFLSFVAIAYVVIICIYSANATPGSYLYNAYSPEFDEYFVVRSHTWLPIDTTVYFNDSAIVTSDRTQYTACILSVYK